MTPFNQVDKNLLSYRTEIEQQNASQAVPTKPPTPSVQLPAVVSKSGRNSAKQPQTKLTNKSLTKESQSFDLNNDDSSIGNCFNPFLLLTVIGYLNQLIHLVNAF